MIIKQPHYQCGCFKRFYDAFLKNQLFIMLLLLPVALFSFLLHLLFLMVCL